MSFFAELRRRNVFKVGIAYAIVAWLLIQITSTVAPALHLPDWTLTFIVYLTIIGFPLAVFLAWAYELTPEGIKATTTEGPAQYHTRTTGQRLNYFILGVVVLAVGFMLVDNYVLVDIPSNSALPPANETVTSTTPAVMISTTTPSSADVHVRRYDLNLGQTRPITGPGINSFVALSNDDKQLVYAVNIGKGMQLFDRLLDQLSVRELSTPGRDIYDVFFSPDGEWVGFSTINSVYKVSVHGGPPQQICKALSYTFGGYWSEDGYIYFGNNQKLHRVPSIGGTPEPVRIQSEQADWSQRWPYGLPDKKHLLLTVSRSTSREGQIVLLNLETGETKTLIRNGFNARYVPTGHIVFMRSDSLWAVPFDVNQLKTTGPEVLVVNGVETAGDFGQAVYAFSTDGLLVYLPGGDVQARGGGAADKQLVWVDRDGTETPLPVKAQDYDYPRLSPDATQVAVQVTNQGGADIWTYDLARNILSRRTFSGNTTDHIWTPDGTRLVYSFWPDYHGLAWVKADGTGQPEPLLEAQRLLIPTTFTPDGSQLVYNESTSGPTDIYVLSLTGEHIEQPLLATRFDESNAAISPDGRWMAYQSNETGRFEIYLRPYPNVDDGKWQVSTDGGVEPHWRGDSKELFYRRPGYPFTMYAVSLVMEPQFEAGTPVELFRGEYYITGEDISYNVTADGQRFLTEKRVEEAGADITSKLTSLVVVDNWFAELKRLAPPAQ